jgi:predicted Zn-dependent peptidase
MEFKHKVLENGLTIVGEVNCSAKSAAVGFFVKTGSRDETEQINGVSHFLEHMLFKGTEKLSALEVNKAFDRTGAQFNACTTEENTVYYAAVLPEYLEDVTALWIELMRPALRTEDFDIEKHVIKEEIAMYNDLPQFEVMEKGRKLYFDMHPLGNSVLGSKESITDLTAEQMRDYFTSRYAPNNMVLACSGNFDWARFCALVEPACSAWHRQATARRLGHADGTSRKQRIEKAHLAREHICLVSSAPSAQDLHRFAASVLSVIVGDDVGSRFFWELVDKALAEVAAMQYGAMDGAGAFCSYISCSSDNVREVTDTVTGVFDGLERDGISTEELRKAKNKILSASVLRSELPMGRLTDLGLNWIYRREYRTVQEDMDAIRAVTIDQVNELIRELKPGDFAQLAMGEPERRLRLGETGNDNSMDADILKCKADILRARDVIPPYDKEEPPARTKPEQTSGDSASGKVTDEETTRLQEGSAESCGPCSHETNKPPAQQAAAKQNQVQIPSFDLADNIMAEQRRVAAARRKAPGDVTVERQSHKTTAFDSRPGRRESSPSPEGVIISAIVARDIEGLCAGNG